MVKNFSFYKNLILGTNVTLGILSAKQYIIDFTIVIIAKAV